MAGNTVIQLYSICCNKSNGILGDCVILFWFLWAYFQIWTCWKSGPDLQCSNSCDVNKNRLFCLFFLLKGFLCKCFKTEVWREGRQGHDERGGAMREEICHTMKRRRNKRGNDATTSQCNEQGSTTREVTRAKIEMQKEMKHNKRDASREAAWLKRQRCNKRGGMTRETAWQERRQQAQHEIRSQERRHDERDHGKSREEAATQWERCKERGNKCNKRDAMREAAGNERGDG